MKQKGQTHPDQSSLFGPQTHPDDGATERVTSEAEVRLLARAHFNLPTPPDAEPPLLKARRRLRAEAGGAGRRGLTAKWAPYNTAKGFVRIHDPVEGEEHDLAWKDAPSWARWEATKRAQLYKAGDKRAYDLTSLQMHDLWEREQPEAEPDYIVEEHPLTD